MEKQIIQLVGLAIFITFMQVLLVKALLFPASSVLQVTASISVPVANLPAKRKIIFDWGLQMNYDVPYTPTSFYNVPIFPTNRNISSQLGKRDIEGLHKRRDYTLKELYEAFEEILESYDYHRSCLPRLICELIQTPFESFNGYVASDFIHFIERLFRPSLHQKEFGREKGANSYLLAERNGFLGLSCPDLYTECLENPLDMFSKIDDFK